LRPITKENLASKFRCTPQYVGTNIFGRVRCNENGTVDSEQRFSNGSLQSGGIQQSTWSLDPGGSGEITEKNGNGTVKKYSMSVDAKGDIYNGGILQAPCDQKIKPADIYIIGTSSP
jgi:hypothetical protein